MSKLAVKSCFFAIAGPLALGCFGEQVSQSPPVGSGAHAGGQEGSGGVTAGQDPADGGAGGHAGEPTGGSTGEGGEDPDPYCAHAWNGFQSLEAHEHTVGDLRSESGASGAEVRAKGALAMEHAVDFELHVSRARQLVHDLGEAAAFDDMFTYQAMWMLPEAELAASASSFEDYQAKSAALLLEPGVEEAAEHAEVAVEKISEYTRERCGSEHWPD